MSAFTPGLSPSTWRNPLNPLPREYSEKMGTVGGTARPDFGKIVGTGGYIGRDSSGNVLGPGPTSSKERARGIVMDPFFIGKDEFGAAKKNLDRRMSLDPDYYRNLVESQYYGNEDVFRGRQMYGGQISDWTDPNSGIGQTLSQLDAQRRGENSVVDAAARAEAQRAQQGIAQQAAMGSRGAMSPAAQRQAMMQQSQVGAQMAAQVAAAKAQERQDAQRAYLEARNQQLQNVMSYKQDADAGFGNLEDIIQTRRTNYFGSGPE